MAVIIAPWEADDRPAMPRGLALGVRLPEAETAADLEAARDLGCTSVVLAVSRERLLDGAPRARPAGLGELRRRLDSAMARGLRPIVVLDGGDRWLERDAAPRFADFAEQAGRAVAGAEAVVPVDEPARVALRWAASGADPVAVAGALAAAVRLSGEALRESAGARVGATVEIATAFPESSSREDASAARFAEAARTHAWLDLALGRPGAALARLAGGASLSAVQARWLGAVDGPGSAPADVIVARPTPASRVVRAGTPLGVQEAPAPEGGWDPSVALLAALADAPESVALFVSGTGGAADDIEAGAEAWRRTALRRSLRGWIAGDLRGDPGFVASHPETGRQALTPLGQVLQRIVEEWS